MNKASKTKVPRKGFTLVPNFACTGFMMQGETLDGGLADCGDILDLPGLTEMITTYVILSRVRKADNLLLMRAFSSNLFNISSSPGPKCLLKFLRVKFSSHEQEVIAYGLEEAIAEYRNLIAEWEMQKKVRKCRGMQWKCYLCRLYFPGSGFQDCKDQDKSNNIERLCTIEGYWRRCLACKVQVSKQRASRSVTGNSSCSKMRRTLCFATRPDLL